MQLEALVWVVSYAADALPLFLPPPRHRGRSAAARQEQAEAQARSLATELRRAGESTAAACKQAEARAGEASRGESVARSAAELAKRKAEAEVKAARMQAQGSLEAARAKTQTAEAKAQAAEAREKNAARDTAEAERRAAAATEAAAAARQAADAERAEAAIAAVTLSAERDDAQAVAEASRREAARARGELAAVKEELAAAMAAKEALLRAFREMDKALPKLPQLSDGDVAGDGPAKETQATADSRGQAPHLRRRMTYATGDAMSPPPRAGHRAMSLSSAGAAPVAMTPSLAALRVAGAPHSPSGSPRSSAPSAKAAAAATVPAREIEEVSARVRALLQQRQTALERQADEEARASSLKAHAALLEQRVADEVAAREAAAALGEYWKDVCEGAPRSPGPVPAPPALSPNACAICGEEVVTRPARTLKCGHTFHLGCLHAAYDEETRRLAEHARASLGRLETRLTMRGDWVDGLPLGQSLLSLAEAESL